MDRGREFLAGEAELASLPGSLSNGSLPVKKGFSRAILEERSCKHFLSTVCACRALTLNLEGMGQLRREAGCSLLSPTYRGPGSVVFPFGSPLLQPFCLPGVQPRIAVSLPIPLRKQKEAEGRKNRGSGLDPTFKLHPYPPPVGSVP